MPTRRTFLASSALTAAALATAPSLGRSSRQPVRSASPDELPKNPRSDRFRPTHKLGMGGTQVGSVFFETPDDQADETLEAAYTAGIRYFDTSPWYGLGLSERRMGNYLDALAHDEYMISTKVGRILTPDADAGPTSNWAGRINFSYTYDYTAEGVRRSVEESLHRMGIPKLDIVFIHDLAPSNGDFSRADYEKHMKTAIEGAMPELTRMRDEGLIKAWGMGVNDIEPAVTAVEEADPDITLLATEYSLVKHEDALEKVFPKYADRGASIIVGAPLMAGFLAGVDRYLYSPGIPEEAKTKLAQIEKIAKEHGVDVRTAALQFTAAPEVVSATIPGPRSAQQVRENVASFKAEIPSAFWDDLRTSGVIAENAPTPS